ncbi:MAG TPA: adenylate cyclase regulatory domain-containing protein [Acidimicrobiales bacterium]|nr:adenylate cyclase regulatory domain-containing protein [Acidimicrobiales bacterium]
MSPEDDADQVRPFLLERGVPPEEIDRASEEGRLPLLVVDAVIMPGQGRYSPTQVAELSGMALEQVKRFWRALGFPDVPDDEKAFGDSDLDALSTLQGLLAYRMADLESAVQMARVIGSSMARIAEAEVTASPVLRGGADSAEMAELFVLTADAILPGISRLLDYSWRRHLQAAARRAMLMRSHVDAGGAWADMAVGFADLVGFTVLSQQLSEAELAEMVARFEALAHDTVTVLGGRVVKMIGDEVMYVAQDPLTAAEVALSLSEAYADDEVLSDVRVGLACGAVLVRDGDYYGPVVNQASRIVNIAAPGSVLTSEAVHEALAGHEGFSWRALRPRYIKDLGRTLLFRLSRPGANDQRRSRLGVRLRPGMRLGPERLLERVERLIPPALDPRADGDGD